MKKFFALLLTLVMVLSLAACSSAPDKQPAIDAFNETSAVFNEAGAIINENADAVDPEVIATFQDMSALLNQYGELLRGDTEIEPVSYTHLLSLLAVQMSIRIRSTWELIQATSACAAPLMVPTRR